MPAYSTLCAACGSRNVIYRKIADRDNLDPCTCGGAVSRILDKPMVIPEITPYVSPNGDRVVNSRAQRRDDLARSGAYEWEPGIKEDIRRKHEQIKAEAFKPISDAVDSIVRDLNTSGKLENLNA